MGHYVFGGYGWVFDVSIFVFEPLTTIEIFAECVGSVWKVGGEGEMIEWVNVLDMGILHGHVFYAAGVEPTPFCSRAESEFGGCKVNYFVGADEGW